MQSEHHHHRVHIPPIPDLRFEASYLRSISPYVHVSDVGVDPETEGTEAKGTTAALNQKSTVTQRVGHAVRVEWGSVAWITVRDQIISPLIQGALWGAISPFVTPFLSLVQSKLRSGLPHAGHPEGSGVGWLRGWIKGLVPGVGSNGQTTTS